MARVLFLGGLAWLGVIGLFVWGLRYAGEARVAPDPPPPIPTAMSTDTLPDSDGWWTWRVTRATTAHQVMVVDVEARRLADSLAIAAQIVEPVRDHGYLEILIYVHDPFATDGPVRRRVQWTPRGGFVELIYQD